MNLPVVTTPKFDLTLPISGKKIKYRPYLVKEQKIILQAIEMGDPDQLANAMRDSISSCTFNDVDIEQLPFADVEYILLNIRGKSSGEIVELFYRCNHIVEGEKCNERIPVQLDLSKVEVPKPEKESETIDFGGAIGMVMEMPTYKDYVAAMKIPDKVEQATALIYACTKSVYDNDQVWGKGDFTREDLDAFVMNLMEDDFKRVDDYIKGLPQLQQTLHLKCAKCGTEDDIELKGLDSFLD